MKKLLTSITPLACVAIAALMLAAPSQANAQRGYGFGGFGGPFGSGFGGFGGSPYAAGRIPTPPYFALHPPVYYSAPVPRSYGYSPFPYPGSVRTPDVTPTASPQMIQNPYVKPQVKKVKVEETKPENKDFAKAEIKPLLIVNPYVTQDTVSNVELVKN